MAGEIAADLGLRSPGGPAWLRDNPFLIKTNRTELRRFSVGLRLLVAIGVLGGLLLGGLWLQHVSPAILSPMLFFLLGASFPTALFVFLSFAHVVLIANARTALTVSLGDEVRRGTLPDLLLTPLRRAEMLLAMGVGPSRTALLVALAGLPLYVLMAEFGGLSAREIVFLYVLFALLSYAPPGYTLPALSGLAATPETPQGKFLTTRARKPSARSAISATAISFLLGGLFLSQVLGLFGGGWLSHLLLALHISMGRAGPGLMVFGWPYYSVQILGGPLDFFRWPLPPLWYVLPLVALNWAAGALEFGLGAVGGGREGNGDAADLFTGQNAVALGGAGGGAVRAGRGLEGLGGKRRHGDASRRRSGRRRRGCGRAGAACWAVCPCPMSGAGRCPPGKTRRRSTGRVLRRALKRAGAPAARGGSHIPAGLCAGRSVAVRPRRLPDGRPDCPDRTQQHSLGGGLAARSAWPGFHASVLAHSAFTACRSSRCRCRSPASGTWPPSARPRPGCVCFPKARTCFNDSPCGRSASCRRFPCALPGPA